MIGAPTGRPPSGLTSSAASLADPKRMSFMRDSAARVGRPLELGAPATHRGAMRVTDILDPDGGEAIGREGLDLRTREWPRRAFAGDRALVVCGRDRDQCPARSNEAADVDDR